jgi:uncharacterized protein
MKITTFKQTMIGFISAVVILTPLGADALTVEEVTNPRQNNDGWVTDMADILSDETETKLDRLIAETEATNGTEIAVVTVPDTASAATPKAFATELFNYRGIGKADTNNGVLFLISVGDRRVEIETGTGLQTILPDSEVKEIIDTKITPQYKQGNYDRGTLNGTKALVVALDSTTGIKNWLLFPIAAVGGGIVYSLTKGFLWWSKRRRNVYVNPHKTTVDLQRNDSREVHCAKCQLPMVRKTNIELTEAQQTASELGGVSYRGYKCLSCNDEANPHVIVAYFSKSDRYQTCPDCQELTVTRSEETIKEATQTRQGKRLITKKCHCCDYQTEKTTTIPRLYNHSTSNYHNHSNNSSSSIYHSGGSYGGGSDSGGSFGGGSSDGGGAGGSY